MNSTIFTMFFLASTLLSNAQPAPPSDPTLDTTGLPAYLRALPLPSPEPWVKITEKQRFDHYAGLTFSAGALLGSLSGAAISQWMNSPEEWGQGWKPYGKRVASSYSSSAIAYTTTYATSALFKEDNRYFRSKSDKFGARLGSVIISPYVARNNAGGIHFSASSFLGSAAASGVPLLWAPRSWQGWSNVGINYSVWYGGIAGVNLVREFMPSVMRSYRAKRASKSAPAAPPKK